MLPRIEISSKEEADQAVSDFTDSLASAYRLLTSKVTLSDMNNHDLPGLDCLLKQKQRLRELWQETRDPACKPAVNWLKKTIRQMTRRKALEWWETKIGDREVTQAIWPIVKSLIKRDGPKAPTVIHSPLGPKYLPTEKTNMTAGGLENQFTLHDLCDENHKWWVEARVQALLEAVEDTPLEK
jgi:hypothetical protein